MLSQKPQNDEAVLNPDIGGSRMSVRILVLAGPMQLFSRAWRRPSRTSCNQPTGSGPVAMAADSLPEECRFAARAAARTECSQHGVTDLNGLHRAFQMRAKAVLRVLARLWASHTGC
jgi:hypothetical protein